MTTLARLQCSSAAEFTLVLGGKKMIVNISEPAADAALDAIGAMMNAGSIELLTGDGDVLATLKLSDPAAEAAVDGELHFNAIGEGIATARGVAETGRVVAADGEEVFSCDVGDEDSDAVIRLSTTQISRGGPVRINSFKLLMP